MRVKTVSTIVELAGLGLIAAGVLLLAGVAWALISAGIMAVAYSAALVR